jgi:hypothetical protein
MAYTSIFELPSITTYASDTLDYTTDSCTSELTTSRPTTTINDNATDASYHIFSRPT